MKFNLEDRIRVAYKKLKQMVYYEKNSLGLRYRLAVFECRSDYQQRLDKIVEVIESKSPHETPEFRLWLDEIRFDVIPKTLESQKNPSLDQGSFVSNFMSEPEHNVKKVNYIFDGPVELHLLSVLWLMIEGFKYDEVLANHCFGYRIHDSVKNEDDSSAHLFIKYHELYAKWRDKGIQKAKKLLIEDAQSVCVVGLDVQEFYYHIRINWEEFRSQITNLIFENINRSLPNQYNDLGVKLWNCMAEVCKSYQEKLRPSLKLTHSNLTESDMCLPIGFCASPVIANLYLKKFDDAVLEKIRPDYYGRYIDDILMVVSMSKPPEDENPIGGFMQRVLVNSEILSLDKDGKCYEILCRPGLTLQTQKCILQYFDAEHSLAGLDKFQKQIEENASDFALLPVEGDDNPVTQVAFDLLYDGSVNKFRSVKAIAVNRWELASQLAKQIQLHLMTEGVVDKQIKRELFKFFKGRNAIDYWDMWERVISYLVVSGDNIGSENFKKAMIVEIKKVKFSNTNREMAKVISLSIQQYLENYLDTCMELCLALLNSTNKNCLYWRKSNLIRHHLVAIPLLNYTDYDDNLVSPSVTSGLKINKDKATRSPRFVHFHECLGFVNSGYAISDDQDFVTRANEVYKLFHGHNFEDVTSEVVNEGNAK